MIFPFGDDSLAEIFCGNVEFLFSHAIEMFAVSWDFHRIFSTTTNNILIGRLHKYMDHRWNQIVCDFSVFIIWKELISVETTTWYIVHNKIDDNHDAVYY